MKDLEAHIEQHEKEQAMSHYGDVILKGVMLAVHVLPKIVAALFKGIMK
jgi:hypothetical protein